MQTLTDGGRILTPTESILANYLEDERQAVALAPFVHLEVNPTHDDMDNAIAEVLVNALRAAGGKTSIIVEFLGGERRDTIRNHALRESIPQRNRRESNVTTNL